MELAGPSRASARTDAADINPSRMFDTPPACRIRLRWNQTAAQGPYPKMQFNRSTSRFIGNPMIVVGSP